MSSPAKHSSNSPIAFAHYELAGFPIVGTTNQTAEIGFELMIINRQNDFAEWALDQIVARLREAPETVGQPLAGFSGPRLRSVAPDHDLVRIVVLEDSDDVFVDLMQRQLLRAAQVNTNPGHWVPVEVVPLEGPIPGIITAGLAPALGFEVMMVFEQGLADVPELLSALVRHWQQHPVVAGELIHGVATTPLKLMAVPGEASPTPMPTHLLSWPDANGAYVTDPGFKFALAPVPARLRYESEPVN